ncbi:hypothetical protein Tco_0108000 [Tanacetum coccineum]
MSEKYSCQKSVGILPVISDGIYPSETFVAESPFSSSGSRSSPRDQTRHIYYCARLTTYGQSHLPEVSAQRADRLSEPISRSLCQSSYALLKSRIQRSFCVSGVLPLLRLVRLISKPSVRSLHQSLQPNNLPLGG